MTGEMFRKYFKKKLKITITLLKNSMTDFWFLVKDIQIFGIFYRNQKFIYSDVFPVVQLKQ